MSSLTTLEKRCLEDLFGMSGGSVLKFTNQSFTQLFIDTVQINIYSTKYSFHGDSKAQRLRAFWEEENDTIVGKVLNEIFEIWKYENKRVENIWDIPGYIESIKTINRLLGKPIQETTKSTDEEDFLTKDFGEITASNIIIEPSLIPVLNSRIEEARIGLKNGLALSVIFLCGSVLEGILLSVASKNPQKYNQAQASPKDDQGKVKPFYSWTLSNFIDVSCEIGLLGLDVKKFSHALRDFRNYIHPYQQMISGFNPDKHTAEICMQVLKAAIADIGNKQSSI